MTDRMVPAPTPSPVPSAGGAPRAKQALFDAAVDVVRKQSGERVAERAAEEARRRQSRVSPIIAVGLTILLGVGVYLGVEQPAWLFPPAPPMESRETQDASLRISMATTMQRIERFRLAQGRLPRSLAEAGTNAAGISYEQREGDRYVLRGTSGPVQLTLSSEDSLPAFVGNSFRVLAMRAHR
jgi:hypothetical protein